jgi:hypothetical protein
MLAFATPAALLALAAVAIPIALHLWSRRTGRAVRVGSIALFAAAVPPAARRPQVDDPWLLLVRCAVITLLALALAGPYRRSDVPPAGPLWALVAPDIVADARSAPLLDSLRSAGAEIRPLAAGATIWSLLREADYTAPPGTRFVVVAPNRGAMGERPALRAETSWRVPPLRITERGTGGEDQNAARAWPTRTVTIYSDAGRREDARYVGAALRAAGDASGKPAVVTQRDVAATPGDADWIVWLAEQPVPDAVLASVRGGATLLTDALADRGVERVVRLRLAAATNPDAASPLLRRVATPDHSRGVAPVWSDDAGLPVMTLTKEGAGRRFRFHGRFHPSWGDLVLHPAFPEAMTPLWAGAAPDSAGAPITVSQLLPARDTVRSSGPVPAQDLYHVFWLAGVVLFGLERWLAVRRRQAGA